MFYPHDRQINSILSVHAVLLSYDRCSELGQQNQQYDCAVKNRIQNIQLWPAHLMITDITLAQHVTPNRYAKHFINYIIHDVFQGCFEN